MGSSSLGSLPAEILTVISKNLPFSDFLKLSEVSRELYNHSRGVLFTGKDTLAKDTQKKLVNKWIQHADSLDLSIQNFFCYLRDSDSDVASRLTGFLQIMKKGGKDTSIPNELIADLINARNTDSPTRVDILALETLGIFAPYLNKSQITAVLPTLRAFSDNAKNPYHSSVKTAKNAIAVLAPRLGNEEIEFLLSDKTLDILAPYLTDKQIEAELDKVKSKENMSDKEKYRFLDVSIALSPRVPITRIEPLLPWLFNIIGIKMEVGMVGESWERYEALIRFRALIPYFSDELIKSTLPILQDLIYEVECPSRDKALQILPELLLRFPQARELIFSRMIAQLTILMAHGPFLWERAYGAMDILRVFAPHLNDDQVDEAVGALHVLLQQNDHDKKKMALRMLAALAPRLKAKHIDGILTRIEDISKTDFFRFLEADIIVLIASLVPHYNKEQLSAMFRKIYDLELNSRQLAMGKFVIHQAMAEFIPYLEPFDLKLVLDWFEHMIEYDDGSCLGYEGLLLMATNLVPRLKSEEIEGLFFNVLAHGSMRNIERDLVLPRETFFILAPYLDAKFILISLLMISVILKAKSNNENASRAISLLSHFLLSGKCTPDQIKAADIPSSLSLRLMYFMYGCYIQAESVIKEKIAKEVTKQNGFFQENAIPSNERKFESINEMEFAPFPGQ